ncbi:hypothetical protein [Saccharopolyspora rosea]|uniref:Uncharacterized protein n=1 Tax=Saccharopolyspora rosea TaxID=524884 RepID=A0ABW3FSR3_9PSEU|nr:hypothetical protein [Saccharopolyspora rosea]
MADDQRIPDPDAITRFWFWWARIREPLAEAIAEFRSEEFVPPLRDALTALHPDLRFATHPGLRAAHALTITAATPAARRAAAAVLAAAPAPDHLWEFDDLELPPADPNALTCLVGDLEIRMTGMRAAVHHRGATAFIEFFHPMLVDLSPEITDPVLESALAAVLGDVPPRRTQLVVALVRQRPAEALDLRELRAFLAGLP